MMESPSIAQSDQAGVCVNVPSTGKDPSSVTFTASTGAKPSGREAPFLPLPES